MHTIKIVEMIKLLAIILLMQNQEVLCDPNILDTTKPVPLSQNITMCSKYLSQRLADFCDNKIRIAKREVSSPLLDIIMPKREEPKQRSKPIRLSRRSRRQISDECCDKACSIEHLISYCPPNSPIYYR